MKKHDFLPAVETLAAYLDEFFDISLDELRSDADMIDKVATRVSSQPCNKCPFEWNCTNDMPGEWRLLPCPVVISNCIGEVLELITEPLNISGLDDMI